MFRRSQLEVVKFVAWFPVLLCLTAVAKGATITDSNEVEALKDIAAALGKKDWNFTVDPCSGLSGWNTQLGDNANSVTCGNCSVDATTNNTVCHVTNILLKTQSLAGTLPPDFSRLPYLQILDLSRNFLNGTLPPQWSSLPLSILSLLGNRLTGPIPREFGNISTLVELVLEMNQLSGNLPSELGNLPRIKRMLFTSNNFTGEVPASFAKLTTLTDMRFSDNQFNGTIPDFIQNWTNLTKLAIQASGFQGPIPSGIEALINLTDLRVSDLNGPEAPFPQLNRSSKIEMLILRNCNLTGTLPEYLAQMTSLKNISLGSFSYNCTSMKFTVTDIIPGVLRDLSFNRLSGAIPSSFSSLVKASTIFLTGNMLNGKVPDWITAGGKTNIDLSYNNFSIGTESCQVGNVNLFASSSAKNNLGIYSCLESSCPKKHYNLYINCGGKEAIVGSTTYERDNDPGSPSSFFQSTNNNWAYSNTGFFPDDSHEDDIYISQITSRLDVNEAPELYMDARLSPITLTYYGYCLLDGSYNASLHFAEIMFSGGKNYSSLGRRIFDVYIQGKRVLEDFNIAKEAGGVGKAIVKTFTVNVTNSTLEIRLFWTGKGTTAIPTRGVYGPLISAISVNPNFPIPEEPGSKISAGVVAAIVVSVVFAVLLIVGILWWKGCLCNKDTMDEDLKGLDLQTGSFTLRQIKAATNNFDAANKIGEGGFGPVFKGQLLDGTVIAVKQLSAKSKQGNREFVNEIGMISALQHPHLVKLYGCCIEGNQLLLVYEYLENNSLARALFGKKEQQLDLDWRTRHKICVGIARGLAYLHEESRLKIVHRDIKATNVLLDKNLHPKISDFGLAKLDEEDNTHISTRVAGTYGYMAPEYALRGHLTDKADVYSFGIVALEIVSGQSNTSFRQKDESFFLLDWAHFLKERGELLDLIDPRLGVEFDREEVLGMINVALLCTHVSPSVRPTMSAVVSMLEGKINVPTVVPENSDINDAKIAAMKKHFKGEENKEDGNGKNEEKQSEIQIHSYTTYSEEGQWAGSSSKDLYPIIADSDYWKNQG